MYDIILIQKLLVFYGQEEESMRKIIAISMALCSVMAFASCGIRGGGPENSEKPVDLTKTQLHVGTLDGGFGSKWLENYANRFEELHAETVFETGKKGVQVHVEASRDYGLDSIQSVIKDVETEVFFLEMSDYYQLISGGYLLEITDAVTTPLEEYNEQKSIVEKMYADDVAYFKTDDQKYYAIPVYEANYGIIYDIDMFEENGFYFAAEGQGNEFGFVDAGDSDKANRSNGPDGEKGTDDDGLPATYEEFFKLCDYIASMEMYPITWAGAVPDYVNGLMMSMQADYEGVEQMKLNYTLNGKANLVSSIGQDGKVTTYEETITPANGYLLQKQAGRYYALKFVEQLVSKPGEYYDRNNCFSNAQSHMMAQTNFLQSRFDRDIKDVAMLIDGSWWFNEAEKTFDAMENIPGASAGERKLGVLPLPKATTAEIGEATYFNNYMTELCIKSNIAPEKIDCAKQFIRYCRTNEALSSFTADTSTTVPYEYTLEAKDEARISYYGAQLYKRHTESVKVSAWGRSKIYLADTRIHTIPTDAWNSVVGKGSFNIATEAFKNDGITAKQYFEGLSTYMSQSAWESKYASVLN